MGGRERFLTPLVRRKSMSNKSKRLLSRLTFQIFFEHLLSFLSDFLFFCAPPPPSQTIGKIFIALQSLSSVRQECTDKDICRFHISKEAAVAPSLQIQRIALLPVSVSVTLQVTHDVDSDSWRRADPHRIYKTRNWPKFLCTQTKN